MSAITSTTHPMFGPTIEGEPLDDRHPGVHLLEFDGEVKTTAELIDGTVWRICDWELLEGIGNGDGPEWVSRWWRTMTVEHMRTLIRITDQEAANPPPAQPSLDLGAPEPEQRALPASENREWWCENPAAKPLHTVKDGTVVRWLGTTPMCPHVGCLHPLHQAPF